MRRGNVIALSAAAILTSGVLGAASAGASIPRAEPSGHHRLVTSQRVHVFPTPRSHESAHGFADERQGAPPLTNHGGPIMRNEQSYAIYWDPGALQDGSTTHGITRKYKRLIARYFSDVNGSGLWANNSQYPSQGQTPTRTGYAQAWVDTTPFPKNHCTAPDTGTNCVTDTDIRARVVADAAAGGISQSMKKMFFVYTPQDEGSCFDAACQSASYANFCAYHGVIHNGGGNLIYANMPFPTVSSGRNCYYPPGQRQQFPNDLNADAVINVSSHEQIEAVTDPVLNAWYDGAGYEISDECAWDFGSTLGKGGDITLNGHPYGLQKEASNQSATCVLSGP